MSLLAKVKVGNITNLSEARYCAGMGVDFLGFPFNNDKINIEQIKEIAGWVAGPEFVLELRNPVEEIGMIDESGLNFIEIPASEIQITAELKRQPALLVTLDTAAWHDVSRSLEDFADQIHSIRIIGNDAQWTTIEEIKDKYPVLVDYNLFDNVAKRIKDPRIGISLTGNDEIKPGLKNYDHLADVLEQLEAD